MLVKSIYKKRSQKSSHSQNSTSCNGNVFTPSAPPLDTINDRRINASEAYEIVNSESNFDSNPQLNMATFVTTWMEPTAIRLMKESLDINYIDKLIYPQTIELEKRCVSILANLYNASEEDNPTGTSTVGSTEASLLAGMNYKFLWKKHREKYGKESDTVKPEIIFGSNVQVCWKKFAKYFEVKPIIIPIGSDNKIDVNEVAKKLSDKTICVVGILGNTFSGEFDDIKALNKVIDKYNKNHQWKISIHVDAACGGFIAPFYNMYKDIPWDFRLKWVKSINISGHKYGLVYAGIGWAIWRNRHEIDDELIFQIDYLGGVQDDFSLNFTKNANNVIAQYYNLTRQGQEGYEEIINYMYDIQHRLTKKFNSLKIFGTKIFKIENKFPGIPVVILSLTKEAEEMGIDSGKLAQKIKEYGWSIPAYPLPAPFENKIILRMVLKVGFNYGMADKLFEDMESSIFSLINDQSDSAVALSCGSTCV